MLPRPAKYAFYKVEIVPRKERVSHIHYRPLSLQNGKLRPGSSDTPVCRPTSRKTDLQQLQEECVNETCITVSAEGV